MNSSSEPVLAPDTLIAMSLDSVVQKASDLAHILRTCKHNVESKQLRPPPTTDRSECDKRIHVNGRDTLQPVPQTASTSTDNAALQEKWHQLTSYIVSLEKEVLYYKQMMDDYQLSQQLLSAPTEHAQNMEDEDYQGNGSRLEAVNQNNCEREGSHIDTLFGHGGEPQSQLALQKQQVYADQDYWDKLIESDPMSQVLLLVFSCLATQEICSMARVSRKWNIISKHPLLWRRVSISEAVLSSQVLLQRSQMCTSTESFCLHGLMPSMTEWGEDLSTYIKRTRGCLEGAVEAILNNSSRSLVFLSFTECNLMITERVLWLASVHCPNLTSLSYCSDEFPPSAESLWSITHGCRNLKHLNLPPMLGSPNSSWFNDNALRVIAQGWPNLVSLTVGGKSITVEGLTEVAQCCTSLSYLELIHGPDLDKQAMLSLCQDNSLFSLKTLILNFTPTTHVALMVVFGHCQLLEQLDLHITLKCFFPDDSSTPDCASTYEQIVKNLKKIKKMRGGKEIFHLYEVYN